MDKSLRRTNHDGTPFPSLTPSYSQSWYEVATSSQLSLHLLDPHFQDGTMLTLDATTTVGIQVIPQKIVPHSNLKFKSWLMMGNWHLRIWMGQLKSKTHLRQSWKCRNKRKRPQNKQISRKLQCQRRGYPLPKQALHRPLRGRKNDHVSQTGRKRKWCSKIWSET